MSQRIGRAGLLTSVCVSALILVGTAQAETVPNVQDLYKMVQEQQKRIQELERKVSQQADELRRARRTAAETHKTVTQTRNEVEATRKEVRATEKVMARKEDLDRARAELGTQPSQSVIRIDPSPPGFTAFGEFNYLRPTTNHIAFLRVNTLAGTSITFDNISVKHSFDPGFRAGLGYRFANGMDVAASYSFLRARSTTTASVPAPGVLFLPSGLYGTPGSSGEARYKLNYDVVDFDAGLNLLMGSDVRLRTFGGLRYVRMDQHLGATLFSAAGAPIQSMDAKSDFWGIGPRLGLAGRWDFGWGFNLFGRVAGTLAVGKFTGQANTSFLTVANATTTTSRAGLNPGVEARVGLGYDWAWSATSGISLEVGYSFEHWFNTKPFPSIAFLGILGSGESSNSLGLDGFFATAKIRW